MKLPHPIPYQGSKRKLARTIAEFVPDGISTFYEPFAGSAAMTVYAAHHKLARRFVVADTLEPIVRLLEAIVAKPDHTAARYRAVWEGQMSADLTYFNVVRDRFNTDEDPVDLLYLVCRCVKNAVRFNSKGRFTQSVDKRRLGMRPDKMIEAIRGVSYILGDRVEFRVGDWRDTTSDARSDDFLYMDPPYLGTSIGRDKRYHQQLTQEALIDGLTDLNMRKVRYALSYDGWTGAKEYGPPLPDHLRLTRLLLNAGVSSQSTLSGRKEETIESLYMSQGLASPVTHVIPTVKKSQPSLLLEPIC